ncbi:erythromycin esterase family protein [Robiginitalea sp. SC105]|uniref:erythromycin esterase family protein n=1 Tax=Robiginitalea sp. SC105 TaxID=2762332 RepID=UPI00163A0C96|nr:erythromycin esterase family protein [Robiginitalea sp. SC105]MBC2839514.1 erythromycin esterase family protein [Robiginitalea sp. SC105]
MDPRIDILQRSSRKLEDHGDLEPLLEAMSRSRLVLLGEASHGTHEYYTWRTAISKRLLSDYGFRFIAVEGDWPDFYRVNRYVKHYQSSASSAYETLTAFNRWPTWMWANWETEALVNWLHAFNKDKSAGESAGIYGLDVYSLWESMEAIFDYLKTRDKTLLDNAKKALACFGNAGSEVGLAYARSLRGYLPKTCEDELVELLTGIRHRMASFNTDPEASLNMEQNAAVARNAEMYYRSMVHLNDNSWNIRDRHMMEALERLLSFYGPDAKGIVWEHNTHVGDARATDMARSGTLNIGQLVRERLPEMKPFIVGFGSHSGTVIAGAEWGAPMRKMRVPEAREDSWEHLLHNTAKGDQLLLMKDIRPFTIFRDPIPHRAIGVVYHPEHERIGNYVPSILPERYDAFIHIDRSEAVHPMYLFVDTDQIPETYPWAF